MKPRVSGFVPTRNLTAKQAAFARWYCSAEVNMNGTEAARRAGYRGTDATLRTVASNNLTKPNIRVEVNKRLDSALADANVSVEKVLRDLEHTRIRALDDANYSAAVRCSELQGKYLKMFTDKIEKDHRFIEDVSSEEILCLIKELVGVGTLNLKELGLISDAPDLLSHTSKMDREF